MTSTVTIPLQEYERLKELEIKYKDVIASDFYTISTIYFGGYLRYSEYVIKDKECFVKNLTEEILSLKREIDRLKDQEIKIQELVIENIELKNKKLLGLFKI